MKPAVRTAPVPLAMDPLDASGAFGALSGVLSVVLPYFDGLTMALAALVVGIALLRWTRGRFGGGPGSSDADRFLLALVSAIVGWAVFLEAPSTLASIRGLVLGGAILPLWWLERRRLPFGEE